MRITQGETLELVAPVLAAGETAAATVVGSGTVEEKAPVDGIAKFATDTWAPGVYATEWVISSGAGTRIVDGPPVRVRLPLALRAIDGDDPVLDRDRRILAAAEETLEVASSTADISINVAGFSASYATRSELLAFVLRMRKNVRRREQALDDA